jgi:hypothetical protein
MAEQLSIDAIDTIGKYASQGKGVVEISKLTSICQPTVSKYMK